jgi:dienelactone hydrolase
MFRFPKEALLERADRLLSHAEIIKPGHDPGSRGARSFGAGSLEAGSFEAGSWPTAVMLHGCGKADGPQRDYALAAARVGVASIIINSYAPRRISQNQARGVVCTGLRLWGRERAGDLLAMLAWARTQDWVKADRLIAAGWSHGGWTVMDALALGQEIGHHARLSDVPENPLDGLAYVFLVYPWCGVGSFTLLKGWNTPVPTTMLLGGRDVLVGQRRPQLAIDALKRCHTTLKVERFETATHSFDEEDSGNPAFIFDPELATRAHHMFADHVKHLA